MADLNHHGRAAAARPFEVVATDILVKLVNQADGNPKKAWPFGLATAKGFSHYANG
jgi:hypothetical protein